jgi:antitoxin component YwqK of YwqJK toxin-antitoxin module
MKFFIILGFFILQNQFTFSQVDTILIKDLEVTINGLPDGVNNIIVSSDYTFLQNYEPSITLFTYKGLPFTGVAKQVDTRQITYISFNKGIIHGSWFDEIIWNRNLRFEGEYVNGEKSGQWIESFGNQIFRIENYENNRRNGVSKIFIDVENRENYF